MVRFKRETIEEEVQEAFKILRKNLMRETILVNRFWTSAKALAQAIKEEQYEQVQHLGN